MVSNNTVPTVNRVAATDPWSGLRAFTDARIALGRAGVAIPIGETLSFRLSHARARDAVHAKFDAAGMAAKIGALGLDTVLVESAAASRAEYLTRPDLGRRLSKRSEALLEEIDAQGSCDLAIVVGDGLSSRAIHENAVPFLSVFVPLCRKAGLKIGPVCIANQSRVALGDAVGQRLHAKVVAILIGERPGLSSPDSMGAATQRVFPFPYEFITMPGSAPGVGAGGSLIIWLKRLPIT